MPVLVTEAPVVGRVLVAAEFRAHRLVDHRGQAVRRLDVGGQAEEHEPRPAGRRLLPPDPAIAERPAGADAVVPRNALAMRALVFPPPAGRAMQPTVSQGPILAVEQYDPLGRRRPPP